MMHFAQRKVGIEGFGYAQFGISIIEVAIPLVVAGYNNYGTVTIGALGRNDSGKIGALIGDILALKLIHACVVFGMLVTLAFKVPGYSQYVPLIIALSFALLFSGTELLWVQIAVQRMAIASFFSAVSKLLSLALIILLIASPNDALLYAVLTLLSNAVFNCLTTFYCMRLYPPKWPSWQRMLVIVKSSWLFAVVYFLMIFMERLDLFVVERFYSARDLGLYLGPARVTHSILQIIGAVILAFFSEMVVIREKEKLTNYLRFGFWALSSILAPLTCGIWFVDQSILGLIFDQDFTEVRRVFSILVLGTICNATITVFGLQVLMLRNSTWKLARSLLAAAAVASILSLAQVHLFETPVWNLYGVAIAMIIGKIVGAALVVRDSKPFLSRLPWIEFRNTFIPAIFMAFVLALINSDDWLLNVMIGGIVYIIPMLWLSREQLNKVMTLIRGS